MEPTQRTASTFWVHKTCILVAFPFRIVAGSQLVKHSRTGNLDESAKSLGQLGTADLCRENPLKCSDHQKRTLWIKNSV